MLRDGRCQSIRCKFCRMPRLPSMIGTSVRHGVVLHVSCRPPANHCFCFGRCLGGSLACFVPTARLACLMVPVAIGGWGSLAGLPKPTLGEDRWSIDERRLLRVALRWSMRVALRWSMIDVDYSSVVYRTHVILMYAIIILYDCRGSSCMLYDILQG